MREGRVRANGLDFAYLEEGSGPLLLCLHGFPDNAHTYSELLPELARAGVPAGEVRTLDRVYEWDQTRSQGLVIDVDHPVLGRIELPGPPLRFDDNAHAGGRTEHLAPPALGEHDASVRAWLDAMDAPAGGNPA